MGMLDTFGEDMLNDIISDFIGSNDLSEIEKNKAKVEKMIPKNHILLLVSNEKKEIFAILEEVKNVGVTFKKKPLKINVSELINKKIEEHKKGI